MKSYHLSGYVFNADIVCCDCIADWAAKELIEEGYTERDVEIIVREAGPSYDVGFFAYRSEALLSRLAELWRINIEDEYSFDSDDFPKIIFADQVEDVEYCGTCHEEIP